MNPSPLKQDQGINRRLRIVVLDDEPGPRECIIIILKHFLPPELEILESGDAAEAWQELSRADPDLFITDITHPGMSCKDMLTQLAERKVKYPILVISAALDCCADIVKRDWSPNLNVTFIAKPFARQQFQTALEAAFNKSGVAITDYGH